MLIYINFADSIYNIVRRKKTWLLISDQWQLRQVLNLGQTLTLKNTTNSERKKEKNPVLSVVKYQKYKLAQPEILWTLY